MPKKKTKPGAADDNAIKRAKKRNEMLKRVGSVKKKKGK